jgi:hypothetical protein
MAQRGFHMFMTALQILRSFEVWSFSPLFGLCCLKWKTHSDTHHFLTTWSHLIRFCWCINFRYIRGTESIGKAVVLSMPCVRAQWIMWSSLSSLSDVMIPVSLCEVSHLLAVELNWKRCSWASWCCWHIGHIWRLGIWFCPGWLFYLCLLLSVESALLCSIQSMLSNIGSVQLYLIFI